MLLHLLNSFSANNLICVFPEGGYHFPSESSAETTLFVWGNLNDAAEKDKRTVVW